MQAAASMPILIHTNPTRGTNNTGGDINMLVGSGDTGHGGNRLFTNLLQNPGWYPLEGRFGLAPMILASLAVMLGAILIALPLGLINGMYLEF